MCLDLGYITVLSDSIRSRSSLEVGQQQVSHGYDPLFLADKLLRRSNRVLFTTILGVIAERDLEDGADHFDSHLVLSLTQLMHLNTLFVVTV